MTIEDYSKVEAGQCHAQLELVRRTGNVNMMNKTGVIKVAFEMGYNDLPARADDMSASEYTTLLLETPGDFRDMDEKRLRQIACGAI